MFNLQVCTLSDNPARQALLEAAGRVRAIALVHERLYQSRTLSSIALDDYMTELCEQLARAASATQRGIAVRVEAEAVQVGLDVAVALGLLLNELVSNSLEHAFPEGRGGHILARVARNEDDTQGDTQGCAMRLTVRDDGVGLPADFDRTSTHTLGLKLVFALSEQLRARFMIENCGGVLATLIFSMPDAAADSARRREAAVPD
jgi:two-component sensor histidine kinase